MDRYQVLGKLGDGTFGSVFKAIHIETNSVVAIKRIKRTFQTFEECLRLNEVDVLRKIKHPAIITLREVVRENETLYLVFEYMGTNLYENMRDSKRHFSESVIRGWLRQILKGLYHLHSLNYIHRDIKPENLLIRDGTIKIADFGLARPVPSDPPYTEYISTRWYRAPEVLLRAPQYGEAVDIFAVGAVAAELFSLQPLFPGADEIDQLACLARVIGQPSPQDWGEGYVLADQLGILFPPAATSSSSRGKQDKLRDFFNTNPNMRWYSKQRAEAAISVLVPRAPKSAVEFIAACCQWNPMMRPSAGEALNFAFFQEDRPLKSPAALRVRLQAAANRVATNLISQTNKNTSLHANTEKKATQNPSQGEKQEEEGERVSLFPKVAVVARPVYKSPKKKPEAVVYGGGSHNNQQQGILVSSTKSPTKRARDQARKGAHKDLP